MILQRSFGAQFIVNIYYFVKYSWHEAIKMTILNPLNLSEVEEREIIKNSIV